MNDPEYFYSKHGIIPIISCWGPKMKRPRNTIDKSDAFQKQIFQSGNTIYVSNMCTFTCITDAGRADLELAEHLNGAVNKISYNGANFVVPSLSPIGGLCTSAVFNVHRGQLACQKKITERGCEDVILPDEISDVAADEKSLLVTTKLVSESIPSEKKFGFVNLNDSFVTDVVHTKKLQNIAPGMVEYTISINIPANFTHGIVEVLSATFFNDLLIQLIRSKDGWSVMKSGKYSNGGFVIARDPETSMGVVLKDWPTGAILFPPRVCYKEFEEVNKWSVIQQFCSPENDSIKIPGGVYSYKFLFFFGPIWFCQKKINKIRLKSHGTAYKSVYRQDKIDKQAYEQYTTNRHKHGYQYM